MSRLFSINDGKLILVKSGKHDVTLGLNRSLKRKKSRKMLDFLAESINFAD